MKNIIKTTLAFFIIAFLLTACATVTKTIDNPDKEKKECCSKK
jgi:starvation-inducible outer membrane lipoprotein|tara:strand:- start:164 stop:292 length:129 start_codon:yes stop_codon:yes gene_type:complete